MADSRKAKTPKSGRGEATRRALLVAARVEIDSVGLENFSLNSVRARAGVSNGSVFHHFGSREGLMAAAYSEILTSSLLKSNIHFRELVAATNSPEEFARLLRRVLLSTSVRREFRALRTRAFAASLVNDYLALVFRESMRTENDYLAETFRLAGERKLICLNGDPVAVSYWIQGQIFGRLFLEIADDEEHADAWFEVSWSAVSRLLGLPHDVD